MLDVGYRLGASDFSSSNAGPRTRLRARADGGWGTAARGCRARSRLRWPSAGRGGREGAGWPDSRESGSLGRDCAAPGEPPGGWHGCADPPRAAPRAGRPRSRRCPRHSKDGARSRPQWRFGARSRTFLRSGWRALPRPHGRRHLGVEGKGAARRRVRTPARPSTRAHRRGARCGRDRAGASHVGRPARSARTTGRLRRPLHRPPTSHVGRRRGRPRAPKPQPAARRRARPSPHRARSGSARPSPEGTGRARPQCRHPRAST